jgi:hypothetical protein
MKDTLSRAPMRNALDEFKRAVEKLYGKRLKRFVLFGSWARGEATGESNICVTQEPVAHQCEKRGKGGVNILRSERRKACPQLLQPLRA